MKIDSTPRPAAKGSLYTVRIEGKPAMQNLRIETSSVQLRPAVYSKHHMAQTRLETLDTLLRDVGAALIET